MTLQSGQDGQPADNRQGGRLLLEVTSSLRGRLGPILRFALAFEALRWLVLAPLGAGVLALFLGRWGRCSVGNFEIISFLLSPPGVAATLVVGTIALAAYYLEAVGLILLLADRRATAWGVVPAMRRHLRCMLGLGMRQFMILLLLALPFLAAGFAVLKVLWAGEDLNGLIVLKPPVFWLAVAVVAGLGAGYAVLVGYLSLRWVLTLPTVLFEPGVRVREAMRLSTGRTRGRLWSILRIVLVWLVAVAVLSTVLMGGMRLGSGWVLDRAGLSLSIVLPATAAVLLLNAAVGALLSVIGMAGLASVVLLLYRQTTGTPRPAHEPPGAAPETGRRLSAPWRLAGLVVVLFALAGVACYAALARVRLHDSVEITAHRGGASAAPENTLAAIRKAIEARADWAEIDVQLTADSAIVVVHDTDLARVGGVAKRVAESTLSEIKSVDIGSSFSAEYRGERVPTLDELIAVAGDRIRLNIELKPNGPDDVAPLVDAVLDAVRRAGIAHRCRICSQSYEGIQRARQAEPGVQIGFIAGGQLGDLAGLDVNYLMVSERLATRRLTDSAGVQGIEVHAWTINDPGLLAPLLDRGVDNIITDDPAAMRRRLEEVQRLTPAERLLLRARNLLVD